MKILFFNIEHYLPFEQESQNYQARLPIIHCGQDIEYRDHVHQRDLIKFGRDVTEEKALAAVDDFKPDAIVYFQCWRDHDLSAHFFQAVRDRGVPIISFIWDSNIRNRSNELMLFQYSDCLLNTDSIDAHLRWRILADLIAPEKLIGLGMGLYHIPKPNLRMEKEHDAVLLGSMEGERIDFADELGGKLEKRGIKLSTMGGLMGLVDGKVGIEEVRKTTYLDWDEYDRIIRTSRICISSQTSQSRYQVKGKVFEIIGRGSFCLTDRSPDFLKVFDGVPVAAYSTVDECVEQVEHFLKLDKQREAVAQHCFNWFQNTLSPSPYFYTLLDIVVNGHGELPTLPAIELEYEKLKKNKDLILPIVADACSSLVAVPKP